MTMAGGLAGAEAIAIDPLGRGPRAQPRRCDGRQDVERRAERRASDNRRAEAGQGPTLLIYECGCCNRPVDSVVLSSNVVGDSFEVVDGARRPS